MEGHQFEWTQEAVVAFWNWYSSSAVHNEEYFSRLVGRGVVKFLGRSGVPHGRTLDYGCGPGYLCDYLIAAGFECEGADFSTESIATLNERLRHSPRWHGGRVIDRAGLPWSDASFDLIVCLETIEHILDKDLAFFIGEMRRVVKPGNGMIFLSTPNTEQLEKNQVSCPECGAVFHRMQHVRAFDARSLSDLMQRSGFRTVACDATDFGYYQLTPIEWMWYWARRLLPSWIRTKPPLPHLYWLGERA